MSNVIKMAEGANGDARKALTLLESTVFASLKKMATIVEDALVNSLVDRLVYLGIKKDRIIIISYLRYRNLFVVVTRMQLCII